MRVRGSTPSTLVASNVLCWIGQGDELRGRIDAQLRGGPEVLGLSRKGRRVRVRGQTIHLQNDALVEGLGDNQAQ